jgi:hypothetical protein
LSRSEREKSYSKQREKKEEERKIAEKRMKNVLFAAAHQEKNQQ